MMVSTSRCERRSRSALLLGSLALKALGVPKEEAAEVVADIRRRDAERFQLEIVGGGLAAGAGLLISNKMKPTPLVPPKKVKTVKVEPAPQP